MINLFKIGDHVMAYLSISFIYFYYYYVYIHHLFISFNTQKMNFLGGKFNFLAIWASKTHRCFSAHGIRVGPGPHRSSLIGRGRRRESAKRRLRRRPSSSIVPPPKVTSVGDWLIRDSWRTGRRLFVVLTNVEFGLKIWSHFSDD